jgi:Ferritin-like domain
MALSRSAFLRLGGGGLIAAAGTSLLPRLATAALPPVTPEGDDLGFLAFGAVGERAALAFYREALATPNLFDASERRRLDEARITTRDNTVRINRILGPDGVGSGDFVVKLPKNAFAGRDSALNLGAGLEQLLVGVYVGGAAYTADEGTRMELARLLTVDAQLLAALRTMAGQPAAGGLPEPLSTEQAGATLDSLLTVPGSPGGG